MPQYIEKQNEPITLEEFQRKMDASRLHIQYKSFVAFLYWFGVRRSEALERKREDFWTDEDSLYVRAPPKKHGERQPLKIPKDLPFVGLIIEQVGQTPKGVRVWRFGHTTAWKKVKAIMGEHYYPHYFRLNRATRFLEDPKTTIPQMQSWFGWKSVKTVDSYVGSSPRYVDEMAEKLKRETET